MECRTREWKYQGIDGHYSDGWLDYENDKNSNHLPYAHRLKNNGVMVL
jgi:hypothetical protein